MLLPIAGSKFFIGTRVALPSDLTVELADFATQETHWLEVNGWTSSGALGDSREIISQPFISTSRVLSIPGAANAPEMANTFAPIHDDPGQIRLRAAIRDCGNYAFKVEWGAGCVPTATVTISVADPAVVTWPGGHGLTAGAQVVFTGNGGTLPTGLTAGTVYYVLSSGLTATTFSVATTPNGSAIETTVAGNATSITATAQVGGDTDLFYGMVVSNTKNGGDTNTAQTLSVSVKPNTNIVEV